MVGPSTPDAATVAALRDALPAVSAGIWLNTPQAGPIPAESAAAMAEIAAWELRTGRAQRDRLDDIEGRLDEARAAVAAILAADLDDVMLAHGAEDALARAIRAVDWAPGDRLARVADPALRALAHLAPAGVAVVDVGVSAGSRPLDALPARTRLLAVPAVRATTGERLPIDGLAEAARAQGAATLVDASLALGAVPLDDVVAVADLVVARVDAWLLGPAGLAIVAAPRRNGGLVRRPPVPPDPAGLHLPSVVGLARASGWLSMYVGLPWIHARGAALTDRTAARLGAIPGVELLTPSARATTLSFRIAGWPAARALDELGARIFLLASAVDELDAIRIGLGFWNTDDEIDRLADGVALLAAHTAETLPSRPRLVVLGGQ